MQNYGSNAYSVCKKWSSVWTHLKQNMTQTIMEHTDASMWKESAHHLRRTLFFAESERCFRFSIFSLGIHSQIFVCKFITHLRMVYASPQKLARPLLNPEAYSMTWQPTSTVHSWPDGKFILWDQTFHTVLFGNKWPNLSNAQLHGVKNEVQQFVSVAVFAGQSLWYKKLCNALFFSSWDSFLNYQHPGH